MLTERGLILTNKKVSTFINIAPHSFFKQFDIGLTVKLEGLISWKGKQNNGKTGVITQGKDCDGRYQVKIGKAQPVRIKAANLILLNVTGFSP